MTALATAQLVLYVTFIGGLVALWFMKGAGK